MNIDRGASAPKGGPRPEAGPETHPDIKLGGKAQALLAAMLSGVSDAGQLRAIAGLASHAALRQHMHRLRCRLPRGGVESARFPTRYWLSAAARDGAPAPRDLAPRDPTPRDLTP